MRIGVLTGGGDCPGWNAVIRAVVRKAIDAYGVTYDPDSERYTLPDEQALALPTKTVPSISWACTTRSRRCTPMRIRFLRLSEAARGWGGMSTTIACSAGTERFFRPGYRANLVAEWIPSLEGVREKLEAARKSPTSAAGTELLR